LEIVVGKQVIGLLLTLPLAASPGCTWMYRHPSFPDTTPASVVGEPAEALDFRVEVDEPASA
jgi:hypothetical protein